MNRHVRSLLVLAAIFALGAAAGFLVHRAIAASRVQHAAELMNGEGIVRLVEDRLGLSDAQRGAIAGLRDRYTDRFHAINRSHRREIAATLDSLRADLLPHLTAEQKERLFAPGRGGRFLGREIGGMLGRPKPDPERMVQRLMDRIRPAPERRDTVLAILRRNLPSRGSHGGPPPREEMRRQRDALRVELEPVLSLEERRRLFESPFFAPGDREGQPDSAAPANRGVAPDGDRRDSPREER